jgi:hypothetical protein
MKSYNEERSGKPTSELFIGEDGTLSMYFHDHETAITGFYVSRIHSLRFVGIVK